ncbi:MAG: LPXTG cell wall anchor domain-containing protein [Acidimicrobiales bacterium]
MIRRSMQVGAALLFALTFLSGFTATADAASSGPRQQYSGHCNLTLSTTEVSSQAPTSVGVRGDSFPPNTDVSIVLDDPTVLGGARVGPTGSFDQQVTIPAGLSPGPHVIGVICPDTGVESTVGFQVLAGNVTRDTAPAPKAPLARTGTDTKPELMLAVGVIAIGGGLVVASRRRRRRSIA